MLPNELTSKMGMLLTVTPIPRGGLPGGCLPVFSLFLVLRFHKESGSDVTGLKICFSSELTRSIRQMKSDIYLSSFVSDLCPQVWGWWWCWVEYLYSSYKVLDLAWRWGGGKGEVMSKDG